MSESTPVGGELGIGARLLNVFFAPSKTFELIARRPGWDWLVPVLLLIGAIYLFQSVAVPKMDVDEAVAQQMKIVEKMSGSELPADQREKIEEQTRQGIEAQNSPVRRLIFVPFAFGFYLLVPAIYLGAAAAFGKSNGYKRLLSGYAYTQFIQIIPTLLATVVAWPKDKISANDVQFYRVLKSNVASFLDFDTTHKALLAVLSSVDVFDLWAYAVGTIAVSRVTRFSTKGAALLVGGVWGSYILLKVLLGVVYQSFTGS